MIKDEVEPLGGFIGDAFVQPMFLGGQALTAIFFIMLQNWLLGIIVIILLAVQMAMSQIVALPAVLFAYSLHPAYVPAALAAVGGGHFLPYAWLHRTKVYVILGVAVSLGAFALSLALRREAFSPVLFYVSACYAVAAPLLLRHARRITRAGASA